MGVEMNDTIGIIRELSNAFGPSGFEDDVTSVIKRYIQNLGEIEEDSLRNLYLYSKNNTGKRPILMLDAHTDEVGLMVSAIKTNGLLKVVTLGSWNNFVLTGTKVIVRNFKGKNISGVVASKPVHLLNNSTKQVDNEIDNILIDIGAISRTDVESNYDIHVGSTIIPSTKFEYDKQRKIMFGKAFDCRIGCAALIETLYRINKESIDFDVVGVFSSQEEVGNRGCKVAVNHVRPSIAICFEGASADDTFGENYSISTSLNHGPMLRYMDHSIICNPRFMRYVLNVAYQENISVQTVARNKGGNNASIINTALDGIPVVVISIPVRYIHSPVGISSLLDVQRAIDLAVSSIKRLSHKQLLSF